MTIKFVVCPGYLNSLKDKNRIIGPKKLMRLYGVQSNECVILKKSDPKYEHKYIKYVSEGYIFLHPRSDGNYSRSLKAELSVD